MIYAFNDSTKQKLFYLDAHTLPYLQTSSETVFETVLLNEVNASILIQSSSFRSYAASYNFNRGLHTQDRDRLDYRRLIDIFYIWHLCKYYSEFKESKERQLEKSSHKTLKFLNFVSYSSIFLKIPTNL